MTNGDDSRMIDCDYEGTFLYDALELRDLVRLHSGWPVWLIRDANKPKFLFRWLIRVARGVRSGGGLRDGKRSNSAGLNYCVVW